MPGAVGWPVGPSRRWRGSGRVTQSAWTRRVATGVNFPDALAGSGAAGWWNGPVLLVPGSSIPAEVVTEVNRLTLPNSTVGIILGGTGVVGTTVEDALVTLLGP